MIRFIIIFFFFILYLKYISAICPLNYFKSDGNCTSNEKGLSSLKIIYCNFKNTTSNKKSIISIVKNPIEDFSKITYPKNDDNQVQSSFLNFLPTYPESDEDTCKKQITNMKFLSIFQTQTISLFQTQKRYLCDNDVIKYEFFYLEGQSPCQYISYDYYYPPISKLYNYMCPEHDEVDDFTNIFSLIPNNKCPTNQIYGQSVDLGSKISFPDTCSQICQHGNCINSKCECYSNWTGETCNLKSCEIDNDCLEIPNNYCSNNTCKCKPGFIESNGICIDENECLTKKPCESKYSTCVNTIGSFKCNCNQGFMKYQSIDSTICLNVTTNNNQQQNDTFICNKESGACDCKNGFKFSNSNCIDIDECLLMKSSASTPTNSTTPTITIPECPNNSICENLYGSYKCKCESDYIYYNASCIKFPLFSNIKLSSTIKGLLSMNIENSNLDFTNIFKSVIIGDGSSGVAKCNNMTYQFNQSNSSITCILESGINYNGLSLSIQLFDDTRKKIVDKLSIPYIKSIEKAPTSGGIIKLNVQYYKNFTQSDSVLISLNNKIVPIKSIKKNIFSVQIERGSGSNLPMSLIVNDELSTDSQLFQYQEPFIENYTTVGFKMGGFITIYGNNFGNDSSKISVVLKDKQDRKPIECLELELLKIDTTIKCLLPPSLINDTNSTTSSDMVDIDEIDLEKLIWVTVDNVVSKDLIFFYYDLDDKYYNCDPVTTCNNHGQCQFGQCICNQGWSGPECNVPVLLNPSDSEQPKKPLIQDFNANDPLQKIKTDNGTIFLFGIKNLIEYSYDGEIVEKIDLAIQADWKVGDTIIDPNFGIIKNYTSTLFNYAKITLIFVEPISLRNQSNNENFNIFNSKYLPLEYGSVRLLININNWPFQERTNYLDVVMESTNIIKDKSRPLCRTTSFTRFSQTPWVFERDKNNTNTKTTNNYNYNYLNSKSLNSTEIIWYLTTNDYVSLYVQFINKIKIDGNIRTIKILKKSITHGNSTVNVILRIPYFNQSISFNPTDYKIISNDQPYINKNLTCVVPLEPSNNNKLILSAVGFLVGLLALFTAISLSWYIIRKKKLKKLNNQKQSTDLENSTIIPTTTTTTAIESISTTPQ
ncbi:hypothetical protein RB653_008781 [Dictyostelium firmibasis]|uniref:EGF-like domain-containing protein n=1 Tax=Dictyostelium firmibasis TaxID=79012 RepID=A0AAN7TZS3_9MYCE